MTKPTQKKSAQKTSKKKSEAPKERKLRPMTDREAINALSSACEYHFNKSKEEYVHAVQSVRNLTNVLTVLTEAMLVNGSLELDEFETQARRSVRKSLAAREVSLAAHAAKEAGEVFEMPAPQEPSTFDKLMQVMGRVLKEERDAAVAKTEEPAQA